MRIDLTTRERGRTIPVGDFPTDVAVGDGAIWVALGALAQLTRVNPKQNTATDPIAQSVRTRAALPRRSRAWPSAPACSGSSARTASSGASTQEHKSEEHRPRGGPAHLCEFRAGELHPDIAYGLESLWIVNRAANAIVRIDPVTNQNLGIFRRAERRGLSQLARERSGSRTSTTTRSRGSPFPSAGRRSLRRRSRWATARSTSPSARTASGSPRSTIER